MDIDSRRHDRVTFRPSAGSFLRRHALAIRVAAGLAISITFLLLASEWYFTRAATRELVQQNMRTYAADGRALEQAYREGSDPEDAIDDVLDLVDSMEDRFGILSARLLDRAGFVVVAPRDANLTSERRLPRAQHDGPSTLDVKVSHAGKGYVFVVPLELRDHTFFLQVEDDGLLLHERTSALRTEAIVFTLVALLLTIALFYVVGGRTLAQRHTIIARRAARDPLTDLGNHRSFQTELARATSVAARRDEPLALAIVDLDRFKSINDRHGHRHGDEVLLAIAGALGDGRGEDRAFRIGGDEFALILPGLEEAPARAAVQRRQAAARAGSKGSMFTAGIAIAPAGSDLDPAVLWEQADAALYEGKRSGGGEIMVFDEVSDVLSIVTPAKTVALEELLEDPSLDVAYQPIWELGGGRAIGFEALARPSERYGFDGPAEMFTVAEKLGRVHDLDRVCRTIALERARELPDDALLFLNVSPQLLVHGTIDACDLARSVTAAGVEPARVVLEITERSDARPILVAQTALRLREAGFKLALDDVGAGNAGLEMLRQVPVDFVKIDCSIIAAAMHENQAQAVLHAIVAFANQTDAYVIAEGIETQEMLLFVSTIGDLAGRRQQPIRGGQGYLLGRPSPHIAQMPTSLPIELAMKQRYDRSGPAQMRRALEDAS